MHVVFAVAFKVAFPGMGPAAAAGGGGITQRVLQFATCALQANMQLVVVDVSGV
jgi:hypothetical protein